MRKYFIAAIAIISCFLQSNAQSVSVNTTGAAADPSAMLDVTSTTKGALIPRMSTAQRNAIVSPATGLLVFDTNTNSIWYYSGGWGELSSISSNLWNISSNNIYNTNSANVGIGTSTPNTTALLHVNTGASAVKGFLVTGTLPPTGSIPNLGAGSRLMFYPGKSALRAGRVSSTHWDDANVGTTSIALGYNVTASGTSSIAIGSSSSATSDFGLAIGFANQATNVFATAFGSNTIASAPTSTAFGSDTRASGSVSTTQGSNTVAKGYASTVVGMYNDSILLTNQTSATAGTPLFIVGNGDNNSTRSNAMVVYKNGDTEIDNLKTLKVGGGTTFTKQQAGEAIAGNSTSAFKTYTLNFPVAFTSTPKVIATAKNDPAWNVDDTFVVSVRSVSTTSVTFNILRVDANGSWSQQLRIEWMAWE